MTASTTMTIRLSTELKDKLGRISTATRRSQSFLAAEALEAYVRRELDIVEGIQRGLEDVAAGRVTPHDVAMDEIDAMIAEARARKA